MKPRHVATFVKSDSAFTQFRGVLAASRHGLHPLSEGASDRPGTIQPEWPPFMRGCLRYRELLDEQLSHAARTGDELGARET